MLAYDPDQDTWVDWLITAEDHGAARWLPDARQWTTAEAIQPWLFSYKTPREIEMEARAKKRRGARRHAAHTH